MEHPTYEELLTLIDKTGSPTSIKALTKHVDRCPDCQAEIAAWQRTIRRLEDYGWPTVDEVRPVLIRTLLKWGAAAVFILGLGFGIGRAVTPKPSGLNQMIAVQARQQVEAERLRLLQDALQAVQRSQDENQRIVLAILKNLREKHEADYLSLRHDLETAASVADGDLQLNQQQLKQLAAALFVKDR